MTTPEERKRLFEEACGFAAGALLATAQGMKPEQAVHGKRTAELLLELAKALHDASCLPAALCLIRLPEVPQ